MTPLQWAAASPVILIVFYALVRIGAAAWFKSKQQYDQSKGNGHHG